MKNGNDLTPKQQAFVDNYLVSFNATDAARKAGYKGSDGTIRVIACENLTKPNIISRLSKQANRIAAQSEKKQINVYEEFREQIDFAKTLRVAAQEYLSNPNDPLKLSITPKAHEIEVTYFDHSDMEIVPIGNKVIERPKKKMAQLNVILESFVDHKLEPEKYKIQRMDIRKFALEAIDRTDMCIDKFARMGGDYAKEKTNPTDIKALAEEIAASLIREGHPADQVQAEVSKLFPQLVSEAVN